MKCLIAIGCSIFGLAASADDPPLYNPFRGKYYQKDSPEASKPKLSSEEEHQIRLQYLRWSNRWTLSVSEYNSFYKLSLATSHTYDTLRYMLKVIDAHSNPRNSELLILVMNDSNLKNSSNSLMGAQREKMLKALAEGFFIPQAWYNALMIVGTDEKKQALLDEALVDNRTPYSAWWLSERIRTGKLHENYHKKAAFMIGRDGTIEDSLAMHWPHIPGKDDWIDMVLLRNYKEGILQRDKPLETVDDTRKRAQYIPHDPKVIFPVDGSITGEDLWKMQIATDDDATIHLGLAEYALAKIQPRPERLKVIILDPERSEAIRLEAFAALKNPDIRLAVSREVYANVKSPKALREQAMHGIVAANKLLDLIAFQDRLALAPTDEQKQIALALAGSKDGANLLLASAKSGKVPAAVVTDAAVVEKLKATGVHDLEERLKSLK